MPFAFTHPLYGLLLLGLPLLWFLSQQATPGAKFALRLSSIAILIVALMGPVLLSRDTEVYHTIILDQSASLSEDSRAEARNLAMQALEQGSGGESLSVVRLGGDESDDLSQFGNVTIHQGHDSSWLTEAMRRAADSIPVGANGKISVITDGRSTDSDWYNVARQFKDRQIVLDTYILESEDDEVSIAELRVRSGRSGEKNTAIVRVLGSAQAASIELRDQQGVLANSGPFRVDRSEAVEIDFAPGEEAGGMVGFGELTATIQVTDGTDNVSDGNTVSTIYALEPAHRTLLVSDAPQTAARSLGALLGEGFDVTSVTPGQLSSVEQIRSFDLILTNDVSPSRIGPASRNRIIEAVQEHGTGLLYTGGEALVSGQQNRFGRFERLLPVEVTQQTETIDPSVGLAVILDTSTSMAGQKLELAKQMARATIENMDANDRVGIIEFYGAKHWALPMQSAANKIMINRAIGRMKAIGGTVLFPAIEEAYFGLKNVNTRYKHILIITDAGVEQNEFEALLKRIASDNINVSTVLVGPSPDNSFLSDMALWGNGRSYVIEDEFSLVELVLKEPSEEKDEVYNRQASAVRANGGAPWWGDVAINRMPPLAGYLRSSPRPGARVFLEAGPNADPVLTSWQYGLGRVTAFLAEPAGRGTQSWSGWDDYAPAMRRIAAQTARAQPVFDVRAQRTLDTIRVFARQTGTAAASAPELVLLSQDPGRGPLRILAFQEKAPGLFEAQLTYPASRPAYLELRAEGYTRKIALAAYSDTQHELGVSPETADLLRAVVSATGGTDHSGSSGFARTEIGDFQNAIPEAVSLRHWLILLAIVLFLLDIVERRSIRGLAWRKADA